MCEIYLSQFLPNQQFGGRGKAYAIEWNEQLKPDEAHQAVSRQTVGEMKASVKNATVMEFIPSKVIHYATCCLGVTQAITHATDSCLPHR